MGLIALENVYSGKVELTLNYLKILVDTKIIGYLNFQHISILIYVQNKR